MKISIVMSYHNRRQLLVNTLKSILYYNEGETDFEIFIIDDGSDKANRIADLPKLFPDLNIFTLYLDPKKKKYINPCIPYNIGFGFATGDVILFQNTECLHVGDILGVIRANARKGVHLTFAVYSVNERLQSRINQIPIYEKNAIKRVILPIVGYKEKWTDGDICWYNHSRHRRAYGSFIWAMMRSDLEEMNGFDERFAYGFAYDDAEFTIRLARKKLQIRYCDDPFTIHQYHTPSDYKKMQKEAAFNRDLMNNFTHKEKTYKAPHNTFYKPSR